MPKEKINKVALDSLSAHIAILDAKGVIIETNSSWRDFARANELTENPDSIGENYILICAAASQSPNDESAVIAQGIHKVIAGDFKEFFINYPCHSPSQERWFALRVVHYREPGTRKVILTHENITPLIKVHRSLAKKESLLRDQPKSLRRIILR